MYGARNLLLIARKTYLRRSRVVEVAMSCLDMVAFEKRSSKL
jgi:hypothetical protein